LLDHLPVLLSGIVLEHCGRGDGVTKQYRQNAPIPLRPPARVTERYGGDGGGRLPPASWLFLTGYSRFLRGLAVTIAVVVGLIIAGCLGLWWRLASGPIEVNVVTPWLAAAIEENFGSRHHVRVGGTQIERTENGGTAVRIRDIVVRDADGTVVASAPKAEVRLSGLGLLSGRVRAESLKLVGAELAVRIEQDGAITVFAGAEKHPIATASVATGNTAFAAAATSAPAVFPILPTTNAAAATASAAPSGTALVTPPRSASDAVAALLSWIDIGESGLDGYDLRELGLKNGTLSVDDARTGKRWSFHDITLSLERPRGGGVAVTLGSDNASRPWRLTASIKPARHGYRKIEVEARQVSARDLLLASRVGDSTLQIDMPLSASIYGEISSDGVPSALTGRIIVEGGSISDSDDDDSRIVIDHAEFKLDWDAGSRILSVPFQVVSGGNRVTLLGQIHAPQDAGGTWSFRIGGRGAIVLTAGAQGQPLIFNNVAVTGRLDMTKRHLNIDGADVRNTDVGVAMSGDADFSGSDLRLRVGVAATRMPLDDLKRMWPVFVAPKVRDWFLGHLSGGTLEHLEIGVNAPFETLMASGPPVPDDGLTIRASAINCVVRPADGLPALRDADLNVRINGRDAVVALGKATADLPSGRKLTLSSGMFEVPDTAPRAPPARVRFKVDGPVPATAELLRMDRLRDVSETPFDPASVRGTMSAFVTLGMPLKADLPPGSTNYSITVEATNFSADHLIMGQKVDAALLKATANPQGFQLKGDVRIAGAPATFEYRKQRGEPDAEVRIQGMLDEVARADLGLDSGNAISGSIPIRLSGRVAATSDREGRFAVEADLTPTQIDGLLPGWVKPAGKPSRATFSLLTKPQSIRVEDLLIEGAGGGVKGTIDFDGSGELQSANFPAYGFSDGDRTSLKIDRAGDGALRVILRGDVYDGRAYVKTAAGGAAPTQPSRRQNVDVDVDMKLGAVVGFNGEALRGVELKMSRRAGEIRSFGLVARLGRDATLTGGLRSRVAHPVIDLDSTDAGAFFRFTDVYSRMTGGQMTMTMDPPSTDNPVQQGTLNVRNFAIHDEIQLERAVANAPQTRRNAVDFTSMKVEVARMPGRVGLRDGVVRGPILGGTIDGTVDYTRDEVHMRGTLVPLYGANNLLGQLPLVGIFMGGDKEGLFGLTYEVVGRPSNPVLHINPISALAPGLLRKVFEFPANSPGGVEGNN
jgi:Protein of unknown function